jgi:transposase
VIEVVVARCAGLDIAKASLVACVSVVDGAGRGRVFKRKFVTSTSGLLALRDWLTEHGVTRVGMESTSDYWKPVYYMLESVAECWLLNARHMRAVPGRKTDMSDAEWICDLVAHGLVRPSFVPPAPIRRLRDLTRRRAVLLGDRAREKQRLEKILEDAGVKLSSVATDILGKSGRMMIDALIAGERDPQVMAEFAIGRMRRKIPALAEALVGRFNDHHAFLAGMVIAHVDAISVMLIQLDARIDAEVEPYRQQIELLDTVPGIDRRGAQVIVAEIGVDMGRFTTAAHLASWAGQCPGNNKTGGKDKPGPARPGNRWLKAVLGQAAMSAARTRDSYAGAQYRRIAARRGAKRATVAVGHGLLVSIWHILHDMTEYQNLGADYFNAHVDPTRQRLRLVSQLERLGYEVVLQQIPA